MAASFPSVIHSASLRNLLVSSRRHRLDHRESCCFADFASTSQLLAIYLIRQRSTQLEVVRAPFPHFAGHVQSTRGKASVCPSTAISVKRIGGPFLSVACDAYLALLPSRILKHHLFPLRPSPQYSGSSPPLPAKTRPILQPQSLRGLGRGRRDKARLSLIHLTTRPPDDIHHGAASFAVFPAGPGLVVQRR
jgi:hypothetical protein